MPKRLSKLVTVITRYRDDYSMLVNIDIWHCIRIDCVSIDVKATSVICTRYIVLSDINVCS